MGRLIQIPPKMLQLLDLCFNQGPVIICQRTKACKVTYGLFVHSGQISFIHTRQAISELVYVGD